MSVERCAGKMQHDTGRKRMKGGDQ